MTEPSLVAQTITISHNVALTAGFAVAFSGFMLGYAIGWRQRRSHARLPDGAIEIPPGFSYNFGGPIDLDQLASLRESAEDRVRRSQA